MAIPEGVTELSAARHDLMNVFTSLQNGCTLIRSRLEDGEHEDVRTFLREMLRRIEDGNSLVERLRQLESNAGAPASSDSRRQVREP